MNDRWIPGVAVGVPVVIVAVTQAVGWPGGYFQWYYVGPLAALLPWMVILRMRHGPAGHRIRAADALVLGLAGLRVLGPVVPMSGHVLILVYSMLTIRTGWYRVAGTLVLLQVTWLKVFRWHEPGSWVWGLVLGLILGLMARPGGDHRPGATGEDGTGDGAPPTPSASDPPPHPDPR